MEVVRALNNSAVLCVDADGTQVVLLGKGIGFGKHPGDGMTSTDADQVFVPSPTVPLQQLVSQLDGLPIEALDLAAEIVHTLSDLPVISEPQRQSVAQGLILALADHLSFAMERVRDGITLSYPLRWEVTQLYPKELELAHRALDLVKVRTSVTLPEDEAVAIAMHLVNAQFAGSEFNATSAMTARISQVLGVVSASLGVDLDTRSMDVARFVTHLRYLFVRISERRQISDTDDAVAASIRETAPDSYRIAEHIRTTIALDGETISDNETAYLALHVARLSASIT